MTSVSVRDGWEQARIKEGRYTLEAMASEPLSINNDSIECSDPSVGSNIHLKGSSIVDLGEFGCDLG
jgi:hypothetical protein